MSDSPTCRGIDRLSGSPLSVSLSYEGIVLDDRVIPFDSILNWYFWGRYFFLVYREEGRFLLHADRAAISRFREAFHQMRLQWQGEREVIRCPECSAPLGAADGVCSDCLSMIREGESLCSQGRYFFNFCSSGFFDLIGRNEERLRAHSWLTGGPFFSSMQKMATPFWKKVESHLLWILLWVGLFITSLWLPWEVASVSLAYLSGILFFLSLSLLTSYLLMLFFRGWLLARLRPPPWARLLKLVRSDQLEEAREEMRRCGWDDHPGLLINLARGYLLRGDRKSADPLLGRVRKLYPNHPLLEALVATFQ